MRVAGDVGGTFTDLVYLIEATGEVGVAKASTTPHNFAEAVIETLRKARDNVPDTEFFRSARQALAELPKGTFSTEEWIDDDGLSTDPIYVCVKVTISDDEFVADYTGSSPQVRGPVNCTRTRLYSACRSMFKAITDPQAPVNEGWFRPLNVICPDGTIHCAEVMWLVS